MAIARLFSTFFLAWTVTVAAPLPLAAEEEPAVFTVKRICKIIADEADKADIPRAYFARLIWKESRFDINAVSPVGAEGIAQFMPGTARMRGLENPYDPATALAASATYLSDLREMFGNLGLAAAAYNSGEARTTAWIRNRGSLPYETEDYVLSIMGKTAQEFLAVRKDDPVQPLEEGKEFSEACERLPVLASRAAQVARLESPKPAWGVQVAGNFRRDVALKTWERVKRQLPSTLANVEPAIFSTRSSIGRKSMHVVQIGKPDRPSANALCGKLRISGISCVVVRN